MKDRILKGWNFQRIAFLGMGVAIIIQSVSSSEWVGLLVGAYFASMGLFKLGCASGNCYGGACDYSPKEENKLKM